MSVAHVETRKADPAAAPADSAAAGLTCFLCGGSRFLEVYPSTFQGEYKPEHVAITDHAYGLTGRLVRCDGCEMVTVFPRPSAAQLVALYAQLVDPCYQEEEAGRRDTFRRVLAVAETLGLPSRRVFDIGASTGMFVDEARRAGYDAAGVEPSHWAVEAARQAYNIEIFEGVLPHPGAQPRSYALAAMLDVIEHVDDPKALVRQAADILADGGLLIVTTPDFGSLVRRLLGQRWWHCRLAHVQYFTKATLTRLLTECGFRIERVKRYGWTFTMDYWMSRLEGVGLVAWMLRFLRGNRLGRAFLNIKTRINFRDSMTIFARLERQRT